MFAILVPSMITVYIKGRVWLDTTIRMYLCICFNSHVKVTIKCWLYCFWVPKMISDCNDFKWFFTKNKFKSIWFAKNLKISQFPTEWN